MVNDTNWLLPEGVEEILPEHAIKLEQLRRQILDELAARDFQLVMPPVMEFVDALLTGTGKDLDTQTYKFMDQHTHRMLGIRARYDPTDRACGCPLFGRQQGQSFVLCRYRIAYPAGPGWRAT